MAKKWVNTDIPKDLAGRFKEFLRDFHIKYETSENGDDIHFEVYADEKEIAKANAFIDVAIIPYC